MKKQFLLLTSFLSLLMMGLGYDSVAQPQVSQTGIVKTTIDLNAGPTDLGMVGITVPGSGKIVVRFDGTCIADSGDRIVLAASNSASWGVNDGNVSVQVGSAASGRKSFSHTRVYDVVAGTHYYHAVGQNYVNTSGSGIASIYGSLTAEYFPASGQAAAVDTGFSFSGDLRTADVVMNHVTNNNPVNGTMVVHLDGWTICDPGDRIVLAASDNNTWAINDGAVGVKCANSTLRTAVFSHSRVYSASAGSQTFNAIGRNYVETGGSGSASVYATLTGEYFPDGGSAVVEYQNIAKTSQNLRGNVVTLGSVSVNCPSDGKVLVQFDGNTISDPGDRIVLAASDMEDWGVSDGCVTVAATTTNNRNCFSHSRLYSVTAGSHNFYAVGQNYVNTAGSGIASVYGTLIAKFYPDATTGVENVSTADGYQLFPNPAASTLHIVRAENPHSNNLVELLDINGRVIQKVKAGTHSNIQMDVSALAAGNYLVRIDGVVRKFVKE